MGRRTFGLALFIVTAGLWPMALSWPGIAAWVWGGLVVFTFAYWRWTLRSDRLKQSIPQVYKERRPYG